MNLKINDRINVRNIEYFNSFNLSLKYDSVASTFGFNFYFDPLNRDHAELACVSHFHEAIVEHNGEKLIHGYILSQAFNVSSKKELVQFAGYSLPGVLEDCQIPTSLYPLQSDGLSLYDIAKKYTAPFGLKIIVDPEVSSRMNVSYETTTAEPSQSIKDYLTQLAIQHDIVISHNSDGNLLFTKAKANMEPILRFADGLIGTSMSMSFSGQGLHSEITVVRQADSDGGNSCEYTILNPYVTIVYRPKVIVQTSRDQNDVSIEQAAKNALAAELKNIQLKITIDRWDIDGKIIRPNNVISVLNPDLFIYKESKFFIEQVDYVGNSKETTAVLTCVPVEAYNSKEPKNIFVDAHQNLPRI